ncbi:glycohydrolase toxin TNT-related protein [Pectobacterium sp. LFLA-215]|uniref:glycohydrolase toxin TNT-related protein n=1 Tax=Pectobacterium sp. LFLA-215 TaxID=3419008 RepID=UPI003F5BDBEA
MIEVSHSSVGISTGGLGAQDLLKNAVQNLAANGLGADGSDGKASGTTYAAFSPGSLIIRDQANQQQDVSELSRDVEHANQSISPIFDKAKEQQRLSRLRLIGDVVNQGVDITLTQGQIMANNAGINAAGEWDETKETRKEYWDRVQSTAAYKDISEQYKAGGDLDKGIRAAASAITALAGGDPLKALAQGAAPYMAGVVKDMTVGFDDNPTAGQIAANAIGHAVLGGVIAELSGGNATAGAVGAATGELAARAIKDYLYPDTDIAHLSNGDKDKISNLASLAAMLAGSVASDSSAGAVSGHDAGKNAVDNNYLSATEAAKKAALERKERAGTLTADEAKELADTRKLDKDRDQAIRDICTQGNKSGGACSALVAQAQQALNSYGGNVTYSLIYKDLYPQDAVNASAILNGLDVDSITHDAAIIAIAKETGKSWDEVASQYDSVMTAHAITAALAGMYGMKSTTSSSEKGNSSSSQGTEKRIASKNPNYSSAITDNETGGYSYYDKFKNVNGGWDWPKNLGFEGDPIKTTIPVGTRLDRYGEPNGSFLAPKGTPYEQRALAPGAKAEKYYEYEVIKPLPAIQGKIASAFDQPGGGIQILPNMQERVNVDWLVKNGYLREIK